MDVIRSIGKQSGESVESVAKKAIPRDVVGDHGVIGRSHRADDATYNNGRRTAPSPSQHRAPGTVCRTRSIAAHL